MSPFSHQTIVNLLSAGFNWIAYAMTLRYELEIPPLEGQNPLTSLISPNVECRLWIALECAQKSILMGQLVQSILFWEIFFHLYQKLLVFHHRDVFPPYLKDRYNITFKQCSNTKFKEINEIFETFLKWDTETIL